VVTDATACVGGNTLSFARRFSHVNAVELSAQRARMLQANVDLVGVHDAVTVMNADYITIMRSLTQDAVFMDPPWGGPDYLKVASLDMFLGPYDVADIIVALTAAIPNAAPARPYTRYVMLKTPINYNVAGLKARLAAAGTGAAITAEHSMRKMLLFIITAAAAPRPLPPGHPAAAIGATPPPAPVTAAPAAAVSAGTKRREPEGGHVDAAAGGGGARGGGSGSGGAGGGGAASAAAAATPAAAAGGSGSGSGAAAAAAAAAAPAAPSATVAVIPPTLPVLPAACHVAFRLLLPARMLHGAKNPSAAFVSSPWFLAPAAAGSSSGSNFVATPTPYFFAAAAAAGDSGGLVLSATDGSAPVGAPLTVVVATAGADGYDGVVLGSGGASAVAVCLPLDAAGGAPALGSCAMPRDGAGVKAAWDAAPGEPLPAVLRPEFAGSLRSVLLPDYDASRLPTWPSSSPSPAAAPALAGVAAACGLHAWAVDSVAGEGKRGVALRVHAAGGAAHVMKLQPLDARVLREMDATACLVWHLSAPGISRDDRDRLTLPVATAVGGGETVSLMDDGGSPLDADVARGGRLSLSAAHALLSDLVRALAPVHAAGYLFADVHPGNVLRRPGTGAVALTDFGSLLPCPPGGEYAGGTRGGRWDTMAPEQFGAGTYATGDVVLTAAADAYAAVATVLTAVTGTAPFAPPGSGRLTVPATRNHARRAPVVLTAYLDGVLTEAVAASPADASAWPPPRRAAFAAVLRRVLAPAPAARYASDAELLAALAAV